MDILKVEGLTKKYGQSKALDNVSVSFEKGQITALIGPNGAGKSTFVKSVLGLVIPDSGTILLGEHNAKNPSSRYGVSYLPEKFNFYPFYKVQEALRFFAELKGEKVSGEQVSQALSQLSIEDLAQRKVKSLSKGQLQRVGLASMILTKNDFFIFDEPFSGLDPIGIKEAKELFISLKNSGATVIVNTHILSEMEKLCDKVVLINKGQILYSGAIEGEVAAKGLEQFFYDAVKGN